MKNLNFARAKKLNSNDKGLKMTYLEIAEKVLKEAKWPLTHYEIWEEAKNNKYEIGSMNRQGLAGALTLIIANSKEPRIMRVSNYPKRFWLKARKNELIGKESELEQKIQESQEKEIKSKEKGFCEGDLHPLLVNFVANDERFNLYCKTINANTSKNTNKGLNEWIHPDIVGIHFPFEDFDKNTLDLLQNLSSPSYKIYSFELKKFINNANLKECYFQAVSNSSWANEGYLVAYEIKDDDEVQNELARLNASFGIGVIELKSDEIKFEAKSKELDIDTLDMLIRKNKDFKEFITNVNKDIQTNDPERIAKAKYDKILGDELEKYLKSKNINKEE